MESGNSEKMAAREKYWDECDQAGQVERLRALVVEQARSIAQLRRDIAQLQEHRHDPALGVLLTPMLSQRNEPEGYNHSWRTRGLERGTPK